MDNYDDCDFKAHNAWVAPVEAVHQLALAADRQALTAANAPISYDSKTWHADANPIDEMESIVRDTGDDADHPIILQSSSDSTTRNPFAPLPKPRALWAQRAAVVHTLGKAKQPTRPAKPQAPATV